MHAGALRLVLFANPFAPLASKHHNAAHMRPLPLRPCFGVQSGTPDASGQKHVLSDWIGQTLSMHTHPLRTLKTKRPRDLRPEGVRALPREIGVADLPGSSAVAGVQVPVAFAAQAGQLRTRIRAVAWPQGKQDGGDEVRFHGSGSRLEKPPAGAKAAHDTPVVLVAQLFFNNDIGIPTSGRFALPSA